MDEQIKTQIYNILRGYQDKKFDPTIVRVGQLDESLTVVYDEMVKLLARHAARREAALVEKCPDCGFVLVEDAELPTCYRCDSQEWQQMYRKQNKSYNELIMAVSHKYEGESRHETALKYIQQAEQGTDTAACKGDKSDADDTAKGNL